MKRREVSGTELNNLGLLIAEVDQSESYETDMAAIYQTPTGYALATASGCSCWDGEWYVTDHDTLADLWVWAHIGDESGWQPFMTSWAGAADLFHQAFTAITGGGAPHNV